MGIPLDTGQGGGVPSIKLRNVGDYVDGAIVKLTKNLPRKIYGTNEPKLRPDGTPQTQDHVEVVVIGGPAVISDDGVDRPVRNGEVAGIFIAGRDRWDSDRDKTVDKGGAKSWSGAVKDKGGIAVGDVVRWKFEAEVPGQGTSPRKVRTFLIRSPRADEASLVERCEQLYRDGTAITLDDGRETIGADGIRRGGVMTDEAPF